MHISLQLYLEEESSKPGLIMGYISRLQCYTMFVDAVCILKLKPKLHSKTRFICAIPPELKMVK